MYCIASDVNNVICLHSSLEGLKNLTLYYYVLKICSTNQCLENYNLKSKVSSVSTTSQGSYMTKLLCHRSESHEAMSDLLCLSQKRRTSQKTNFNIYCSNIEVLCQDFDRNTLKTKQVCCSIVYYWVVWCVIVWSW